MSAARVLVVDEEPQIARGLQIMLRGAGYTVDAAVTWSEALASLAVSPPDAVVLDLALPDEQGVELCREVRRSSKLPILVLSAVSDERQKVRALDAGADDFVTRPFDTDVLLARRRAMLRRQGESEGSTG
jgi:two-component system KDP operon response regulator KdpE